MDQKKEMVMNYLVIISLHVKAIQVKCFTFRALCCCHAVQTRKIQVSSPTVYLFRWLITQTFEGFFNVPDTVPVHFTSFT